MRFVRKNRGVFEAHPSLAASAAICPAKQVTKVLRLVIDDNEEKSPLSAAVRGDVITEAAE